jgi:hypothetical protein
MRQFEWIFANQPLMLDCGYFPIRLIHHVFNRLHRRFEQIEVDQQELSLLWRNPQQDLMVDIIHKLSDIIYFFLSIGCQAQQVDARILRILDALNKTLFHQAVDDLGDAALDDIHLLGDPFWRQVALFAKEQQTPQLSVRQIKPVALVLHSFLTALIQPVYQALKLFQLIRGNVINVTGGFIIHGMNNITDYKGLSSFFCKGLKFIIM